MEDGIFVADHIDMNNTGHCKCGRYVAFTLVIYGNVNNLCEECFADIGKKIIDGLT